MVNLAGGRWPDRSSRRYEALFPRCSACECATVSSNGATMPQVRHARTYTLECTNTHASARAHTNSPITSFFLCVRIDFRSDYSLVQCRRLCRFSVDDNAAATLTIWSRQCWRLCRFNVVDYAASMFSITSLHWCRLHRFNTSVDYIASVCRAVSKFGTTRLRRFDLKT